MKLKKKNFCINLLISIFEMAMGVILLIILKNPFEDINQILFIIMTVIAVLKFLQYIFERDLNNINYEPLLCAISCVLAACGALTFRNYDSTYVLSITLLSWTSITAIIKLITIDKMISKKDELYIVKIVDLVLFILIGLLTCINLFYKINAQITILGFYFTLLGVIELLYPITYMTLKKMIRIK